MTDDRKNIKVPPETFEELDADRDMSWPDQLLHWKRLANMLMDHGTAVYQPGKDEPVDYLPPGATWGEVYENGDQDINDLALAVAEQFDYTAIAGMTADEVVERLRSEMG